MAHQTITSAPKYTDLAGLRLRFGGRSAMYFERLMVRPNHPFPQPTIGGKGAVRLWDLADIEQWEAEEAARVAAERKAS